MVMNFIMVVLLLCAEVAFTIFYSLADGGLNTLQVAIGTSRNVIILVNWIVLTWILCDMANDDAPIIDEVQEPLNPADQDS